MYFLLGKQDQLLFSLLGEPIAVPLAVYDPSDVDDKGQIMGRPDLLSEMRQAIRHYEVEAKAGDDLRQLKLVDDFHQAGRLQTVEMSPDELKLAATLQTAQGVVQHGLRAGLGAGEASCVAIAWHRSWTIASDDADALKVLESLHGNRDFPYERIRKLLIRAALEGRITRADANLIHRDMQDHGFWDRDRPFP
jgi:predicted nucleic acid-binding protein